MYGGACFNERCRRKEERSEQGQTNNKGKQHSTSKAVIFELPACTFSHLVVYFDESSSCTDEYKHLQHSQYAEYVLLSTYVYKIYKDSVLV